MVVTICNYPPQRGLPEFSYTKLDGSPFSVNETPYTTWEGPSWKWDINFLISGLLTFHDGRICDLFVAGGGGQGKYGTAGTNTINAQGGAGGGGGKSKSSKNVRIVSNVQYRIIVGAPGQQSSVTGQSIDLSASEGAVGGGGRGATITTTSSGTVSKVGENGPLGVYPFGDKTYPRYCGGGGGGAAYDTEGGTGSDGGGNGGIYQNPGQNANPNSGSGGGGGAGYNFSQDTKGYSDGGQGSSGIVIIRNSRPNDA